MSVTPQKATTRRSPQSDVANLAIISEAAKKKAEKFGSLRNDAYLSE